MAGAGRRPASADTASSVPFAFFWNEDPEVAIVACFLVLRDRVLAEERPAGDPGLALLRRDVDDAIRRFRSIERRGGRTLEDVDGLDLVRD